MEMSQQDFAHDRIKAENRFVKLLAAAVKTLFSDLLKSKARLRLEMRTKRKSDITEISGDNTGFTGIREHVVVYPSQK